VQLEIIKFLLLLETSTLTGQRLSTDWDFVSIYLQTMTNLLVTTADLQRDFNFSKEDGSLTFTVQKLNVILLLYNVQNFKIIFQ